MLQKHDIWKTFSFIIEMKPKSEFASLFVSCPKYSDGEAEPYGLIKLEEQLLELTNYLQKKTDTKNEQVPTKRIGVHFSDIMLDPTTLCFSSWADNQQKLFMCKIKASIDCINFYQKSVKMLEEELSNYCNLRDYLNKIERSKVFNVFCQQCENLIHTHNRNEYEFGILPCDDWLDLSPQMEYFCSFSGCCSKNKHFENELVSEGEFLRLSGKICGESTRLFPNETRIVLSNLFIFFQRNNALESTTKELVLDASREKIILCKKCNVQLGTSLKNQPDIFRLYLSTLHVYGENKLKTSYIPTRFYSMECFLAWIILSKCETYSSMKLLFRSLDKIPQILLWVIEPYIILTKGVLNELPENETKEQTFPTSISFPALKVIYKLFDNDSCQNDPRANGNDSSVGIFDVPLSCSIQLSEILLTSSLALPIPLRALGQFYVGFIRLKDRVD